MIEEYLNSILTIVDIALHIYILDASQLTQERHERLYVRAEPHVPDFIDHAPLLGLANSRDGLDIEELSEVFLN